MAIDTTTTLDYTIRICRGTRYNNLYPVTHLFRMDEAHAWFEMYEFITAGGNNYGNKFRILNNVPPGTSTVIISEYNLGEGTPEATGRTGTLTIVITECLEACKAICTERDVNIIWLNPEGGWSTYVFDAKRTFQLEQGESSTFKTADRVKKYYKKTDVYDALVVSTGLVDGDTIDYLTSLRYAIQVFEYIDEDNKIPLLLDSESFDKYRDDQPIKEMNIRFIYATEKTIQRQ